MSDYYGQTSLDFTYYWRALKTAVSSNYLKISSTSILLGALVYLFTLTFEPQYKAVTVMHVAPKSQAVFNLREMLMQRRDPAYQQTQVGIIQSRVLVQTVVKKHQLHKLPVFLVSKDSPINFLNRRHDDAALSEETQIRAITESLLNVLTVEPRNKSYLIDIGITLPEPELASTFTNALAKAYIDSVRNSDRASAMQSEQWLLERLQSVRSELQTAERSLQYFKEAQNIIGSSKQNNKVSAKELDLLSSKLIEAKEKRLSLEAQYKQVAMIETVGGDLLGVAAVQNNGAIQSVRNEELRLGARLSEQSKRYGPEHRRMLELQAEIASNHKNLRKQKNRVISALKADYELANANEIFLEQTLSTSTSNAQSLGRKQFQLLDLEQKVNTQREIYEAFLERLNKERATGENINTDVRITDPALAPLKPEKTKAKVLVLLSVFFSAFLGVLLAVLRELFDHTVVNIKDIQNVLNEPSLGIVPMITELEASEDRPNVAYEYFIVNKFSHYAEAIRSLRSSLMLGALGATKQRLLFTSTMPSEGKTSMALGTAMAFGQVRKTLLIDADLRKPSIHGVLPTDSKARHLGLSDLCIGTAAPELCIHTVETFGIDILPAGTITPNPQELFCATRFSEMLNDLSDIYDVIIIDSPPCGGLSDAMLLASHVDKVVYVVKAGVTPVPKIRLALQQLKDHNAPIAGIVLNQADGVAANAGYYYAYAYGGSSAKNDDATVVNEKL